MISEAPKSYPLYPLFLSAYVVLAVAARNSNELIQLGDLVRPLVISAAVVLVGWGVSCSIVRNVHHAALVSMLILLAVMFAVPAYHGLVDLVGRVAAGVLMVLALEGIPVTAFWLRLRGKRLAGLTRYLNVLTGILVAFAALQVFGNTRLLRATESAADPIPAARASGSPRPDIFLLVVDKYTGSTALERNYGYRNQPFEDSLRQLGFLVPSSARANYINTTHALASMLNLRYLDDLPKRFGADNPNWQMSYPLVEHNRLVGFLKSQGYRFAFLPTAFPATRQNLHADVQLPAPGLIRPEFEVTWLNATALPLLQRHVCELLACTINVFPYTSESATLLDWKFEQMANLGGSEQPSFVFAHLTLPHEPYVYWDNCRHRVPYWPEEDTEDAAVKAAYVEQIQCLNIKLLTLVRALHQRPHPPIILLQSDHGHGRLGRLTPMLDNVTSDQVAERASIFAAYFLPGPSPVEIPDSITPVNVMRLVIRRYFDADLLPLEDATYWSGWDRPYRFTRVW